MSSNQLINKAQGSPQVIQKRNCSIKNVGMLHMGGGIAQQRLDQYHFNSRGQYSSEGVISGPNKKVGSSISERLPGGDELSDDADLDDEEGFARPVRQFAAKYGDIRHQYSIERKDNPLLINKGRSRGFFDIQAPPNRSTTVQNIQVTQLKYQQQDNLLQAHSNLNLMCSPKNKEEEGSPSYRSNFRKSNPNIIMDGHTSLDERGGGQQ